MFQSRSGIHALMTADDGSLPGNVTEENREAFLASRRLFEIDQYYESIKDFTFRTTFVQVEEEEAKAWRKDLRGALLSEEETVLLNSLKTKLSVAIQEYVSEGKKVFCRLSTRSPKDAVDKMHHRVVPLLVNELNQLAKVEHVSVEQLDPNSKLIAIRKAFFESLSVNSPEEVMEIMEKSSRVVSDIVRALDNVDKCAWNLKLIVREFVPMPIEGEFRGFVCNGKLNGLSQYYDDCYFDYHVDNKNLITEKVLAFFEEIKNHITLESYICDFVILSDGQVKIVELNPFSEQTGACLFNWKKDKEVIENGPFQFRYNHKANSLVLGSLMPWNAIFQKAYDVINKKETVSPGNTPKQTNTQQTFPTSYLLIGAAIVITGILMYKFNEK